jgi:hypothetical protein
VDLYPITELRSYDRIYGSIRDEKHPALAVEKRLHELHPPELRKAVDPREDARHCGMTPSDSIPALGLHFSMTSSSEVNFQACHSILILMNKH